MPSIISAISLEPGTRVRQNKCYLFISGPKTLGFKHQHLRNGSLQQRGKPAEDN